MQTVAWLNLLMMTYQGNWRPFLGVFNNRKHFFNEILIMLMTSQMFIFTDWCSNNSFQYQLSWGYILTVIFFIFVNFLFIVYPIFRLAVLKTIYFWLLIKSKLPKMNKNKED